MAPLCHCHEYKWESLVSQQLTGRSEGLIVGYRLVERKSKAPGDRNVETLVLSWKRSFGKKALDMRSFTWPLGQFFFTIITYFYSTWKFTFKRCLEIYTLLGAKYSITTLHIHLDFKKTNGAVLWELSIYNIFTSFSLNHIKCWNKIIANY